MTNETQDKIFDLQEQEKDISRIRECIKDLYWIAYDSGLSDDETTINIIKTQSKLNAIVQSTSLEIEIQKNNLIKQLK